MRADNAFSICLAVVQFKIDTGFPVSRVINIICMSYFTSYLTDFIIFLISGLFFLISSFFN